MGQRKVYISYKYSCTMSFLMKILLVMLKYLYIQYAWISIMKKQKCECWKDGGTCQNLLTITITSFNFLTVLQNFKGIWNWNLDRNLIMVLLIKAICTVLFEKLYTVLRQKEPRRRDEFFLQNIQNNEIFEIFKIFKNNSWINVYYKKPKRM